MIFTRLTVFLALVAAALPQVPPQTNTELYYLVFLRPAPDRKPLPRGEGERMQEAHMAHIRSMAARGVLVAAGPFGDTPPTISGVFLFRTASLAEARRIAEEDPTVTGLRNTVEVYAWRGPGGIGDEYRRLHREHPETPEGMGVQPFAILVQGPAWNSGDRTRLLDEHAAYAARLRREGKLAAAGPVENDPKLSGIFIFHRIPDEEAKRLADGDPAAAAGVLRVEFHRWWCAEHVLPH
jgi:uncharacterized protein YciI